MLLGVDTGGTFTDFVFFDGHDLHVHKVLSTPFAPEQAILSGIRDMGLPLDGTHIIHGTTVATNAVLEGNLARTAFITNHGLKDILTIGRQARRELYNLQPAPVDPPVHESMCIETAGRLAATGECLEPFYAYDDQLLLEQLHKLEPEAVAINLLFSFLDSAQERHIEQLIPDNVFVTRSSSLLPVYREYERGITTWLNAAIGPRMQKYLQRLADKLRPATLTIMQSSGDTIGAEQASITAVHLLLSGPAGGLLGARAIAAYAGHERLMTFDMGGTSTDVALINGDIRLTDEGHIAGYPIAVPMVDMHTIGAGGGSIAWLDEGNLLQVGPQSAGADPGPACYQQGGTQPTVTDANLVLGHLPSGVALGGRMTLSVERARQAVNTIASVLDIDTEQAALGIIELANEHMARALRVISIEKGYDPEDHALISFGGAGGLHVCALAESLNMSTAIVPVHAGVLSAFGMLVAPRGRQFLKTYRIRLDDLDPVKAESMYTRMTEDGIDSLVREGIDKKVISSQRQADLRYVGQSSTLRVEWGHIADMAGAFHILHKQRYGHRLDEPVELVNLRLSVQAPGHQPKLPVIDHATGGPVAWQQVYGETTDVPVYERSTLGAGQELRGPALIIEASATTWISGQWTGVIDQYGNLILHRAHD